jgi:hypothetical protein
MNDKNISQVKSLYSAITSSDHPEAVIAAFDRDPNFHRLFNSNGIDCLTNMKNYIEASEEGFWQDLITIGPFSALLTAYRESLKRIYSICKKNVKRGIAASITEEYSIYLPQYTLYQKQIAQLNLLKKVCEKLQKDPEVTVESVKSLLEQAGVKKNLFGKFKSMIHTNYKSVIQYHKESSRVAQYGGAIGSKGWTADKLQKAAEDIMKKIESLSEFKEKPAIMEDDTEITPEYKKKLSFIKNMYNIYLHDLKLLGRGIADAMVND